MSAPVQQVPGLTRVDLQEHDLSVPGRVVIQNRVELGPEAPAFRHMHPGEEITYVLEGAVEYSIDGRRWRLTRPAMRWWFRPRRSTRCGISAAGARRCWPHTSSSKGSRSWWSSIEEGDTPVRRSQIEGAVRLRDGCDACSSVSCP
jgi:hypothetical protein